MTLDGSDATHPDPDYSAVYVTLVTDSEDFKGYGITFTLGRGNEIVLHCMDSLRFLVINKDIKVEGEEKKSTLTNCRFTTVSSQIFTIYVNIFHKTEVQTVILRC